MKNIRLLLEQMAEAQAIFAVGSSYDGVTVTNMRMLYRILE
jgi:hypothetical protein